MNKGAKELQWLWQVVIDVAVVLTVGILYLLVHLYWTPTQRGFYCNDESVMHPFKESTVTDTMVNIVGLALPITVIILTEVYIQCAPRRHAAMVGTSYAWFWNSYKVIIAFLFGALSSQLVVEVAKCEVGRLRPHFINVCKPNIDCTLPENQHVFWQNFQCSSNEDPHKLKDARLSFPSGHASFSSYTMLFLVFYLQARMTFTGSHLVRHGLQFACLMFSWYTCMTRISDYMHHAGDVLGGLAIGTSVAILTALFVSDLFPRQTRKITDPETEPLNLSGRSPPPRPNGYQTSAQDQQHGIHQSLPLPPRTDGKNGTPISPHAMLRDQLHSV